MAAEFLAPRNLGKPLCNNKVLFLARYTHDILKKLKNKTLKSCWFAKIRSLLKLPSGKWDVL